MRLKDTWHLTGREFSGYAAGKSYQGSLSPLSGPVFIIESHDQHAHLLIPVLCTNATGLEGATVG